MSLEKVIKYDCSTGKTIETFEEIELPEYIEPVKVPTTDEKITVLEDKFKQVDSALEELMLNILPELMV